MVFLSAAYKNIQYFVYFQQECWVLGSLICLKKCQLYKQSALSSVDG